MQSQYTNIKSTFTHPTKWPWCPAWWRHKSRPSMGSVLLFYIENMGLPAHGNILNIGHATMVCWSMLQPLCTILVCCFAIQNKWHRNTSTWVVYSMHWGNLLVSTMYRWKDDWKMHVKYRCRLGIDGLNGPPSTQARWMKESSSLCYCILHWSALQPADLRSVFSNNPVRQKSIVRSTSVEWEWT